MVYCLDIVSNYRAGLYIKHHKKFFYQAFCRLSMNFIYFCYSSDPMLRIRSFIGYNTYLNLS